MHSHALPLFHWSEEVEHKGAEDKVLRLLCSPPALVQLLNMPPGELWATSKRTAKKDTKNSTVVCFSHRKSIRVELSNGQIGGDFFLRSSWTGSIFLWLYIVIQWGRKDLACSYSKQPSTTKIIPSIADALVSIFSSSHNLRALLHSWELEGGIIFIYLFFLHMTRPWNMTLTGRSCCLYRYRI